MRLFPFLAILSVLLLPDPASGQFEQLVREREQVRAFHDDHADSLPDSLVVFRHGSVDILDERVASAFLELVDGSPSFTQHWSAIASSGFPVVLASYEALGIRPGSETAGRVHFIPRSCDEGRASAAYVLIDFGRIREIYASAFPKGADPSLLARVIHGERLATLAHEVGHLYEVARFEGRWTHYCADPTGDEAPHEACAVVRENHYREEMALPLTRHYGLIPPDEAWALYRDDDER